MSHHPEGGGEESELRFSSQYRIHGIRGKIQSVLDVLEDLALTGIQAPVGVCGVDLNANEVIDELRVVDMLFHLIENAVRSNG